MAIAKVPFKSVVTGRSKAFFIPSISTYRLPPIPGNRPKILFNRIKTKNAKNNGINFLTRRWFGKTLLRLVSIKSIDVSSAKANLPLGFDLILIAIYRNRLATISATTKPISILFEMFIPPNTKIVSAEGGTLEDPSAKIVNAFSL